LIYLPFKSLGGRRRAQKDSANTGWRNESFRGYADYMQTETFQRALDDLMREAQKQPTAIMCGHGERAMGAASLLAGTGHHDLVVLDGGPQDWVAATGRHLETGG